MSRPVEKPMDLRARTDRGSAKLLGALTLIAGVAFVMKLNIGDVIGGALLIYGALVLIPATRLYATRGHLTFTRLRRFAAHMLWLGLVIVGLIAAAPY